MGYETTVPSFSIVMTRGNAGKAWQSLRGGPFAAGDSLESSMSRQGITAEWRQRRLRVVRISTDGFDREQYRFLVALAPWVEHGSYVVFRYEEDGHGFIVFEGGEAQVLGDIRDGMGWTPSAAEPGAHRLEAFPGQGREELFENREFWKAAAVEIAAALAFIAGIVSRRKSLTPDHAQTVLWRLEVARQWLDARPKGYFRSDLLDMDHKRQQLIDGIPETAAALREKWQVL